MEEELGYVEGALSDHSSQREGQTLPGRQPGKEAADTGPWPAVAAVAPSREVTCSAGGIPAPYGFSMPWPVPPYSGRLASALAIRSACSQFQPLR